MSFIEAEVLRVARWGWLRAECQNRVRVRREGWSVTQGTD